MKARKTDVCSAEMFEKLMENNELSCARVASICGVSEHTVRKWIAQKYIPERFVTYLKRVIDSSYKTILFVEECCEDRLTVKLSVEEYSKLSRKALESGFSLEELIARRLRSLL